MQAFANPLIIPAANHDIASWDVIFSDNAFENYYESIADPIRDDLELEPDTGWMFQSILDGWHQGHSADRIVQEIIEGDADAQYEAYVSSFYSY